MSQNSSGDEVQRNFTSDGKTDCQICGQLAHGHHYCILSCRPCAAFFKRCITLDRKYICLQGNNNCPVKKVPKQQRCKACRLQSCKNAGMTYYQKSSDISSEDESKNDHRQTDAEDISISISITSPPTCPNFDILVKVYAGFSAAQQALFTKLHSSTNIPLGHIGDLMVVPYENAKHNQQFSERTKSMLLAMFQHLFYVFYHHQKHQLNQLELERTIDACFGHLIFLSACYLTLKYLPARNDNRFFTAYGHLVIMDDRLDNALWQLASNMSNSSEYFRNQKKLMHKKFMFVQNLRNIKIKIQRDDFTVLMAIIFCIKASSSGDSSFGDLWDEYKEKIMAEWFQRLRMRFGSTKEATIQMAWLISLLTPLDTILTTHHQEINLRPSAMANDVAPMSNALVDRINTEVSELAYISRIATAHERVRSFYHEIPPIDLDSKYDRLESLLGSADNLLNLHELSLSSELKINQDAEQIYSEIEQMIPLPATFNHRVQHSVILHRLLAIGYLKAMPIFRRLTSEEQSLLTRNLYSPLIFFTNFNYTVKKGSKTDTGPDGVSVVNIFRIGLGHDNCVMTLAEKAFTRGVTKFGNIPLLDNNEFALLLAILCTHSSAISHLSDDAREMLYTEQARYSGLLLRHVQRKLGFQEGAKRYADCINLIEVGFYADNNWDLMRTYMTTVRGATAGFNFPGFPKCLLALPP